MHRPSVSHIKNRSHVITVNPVINPPHKTIEISGNQGTKGTRKARLRSGCLRRRRITPSETRTKANRPQACLPGSFRSLVPADLDRFMRWIDDRVNRDHMASVLDMAHTWPVHLHFLQPAPP